MTMKAFIDSISINVADINRSIDFYTNSFDMKVVSQTESMAIIEMESHQPSIKIKLHEKKSLKRGNVSPSFIMMAFILTLLCW